MPGNFFNGQFFGGGFFGANTPTVVDGGVKPSGGIPASFQIKARTRKDKALDRARFGIRDEYLDLIMEVASSQVDRLEADPQKRFEELSRELELRKVQWDGKYLEVLNALRQQMIDEEIAERLQQKIKTEEEEMLMLVLGAAATAI